MKNYEKFEELILGIREMQSDALQEIRDILVTKLPSSFKCTEVIKGLNLDELKVENRNDYRDYIWMIITVGDREYWIAPFYQDQDFETGNIHHQFGRIQFWKNIKHYSKEWCSTPNTPVGDNYHWIFNFDNSSDPKMKIFDKDYSAQKVVDKFIDFLKESGETL